MGKHFFPHSELENMITCEDILSANVCAALKKAAEKLKVKAAEVDKIVREAVKKGITKAKEIIKIVRAKIVELATNFKNEDALAADVCAKIREVAADLKIDGQSYESHEGDHRQGNHQGQGNHRKDQEALFPRQRTHGECNHLRRHPLRKCVRCFEK